MGTPGTFEPDNTDFHSVISPPWAPEEPMGPLGIFGFDGDDSHLASSPGVPKGSRGSPGSPIDNDSGIEIFKHDPTWPRGYWL